MNGQHDPATVYLVCFGGHPNSLAFRLVIAYDIAVTKLDSAPGRIIYVGACLIAAVRLAREERWGNSPRVISRISDAIQLATRIYERMKSDFGHDLGS